MIPLLRSDVSIKIYTIFLTTSHFPKETITQPLVIYISINNKTQHRDAASFRERKKLPVRYICPAVTAQHKVNLAIIIKLCVRVQFELLNFQLVARFRVRLYKCRERFFSPRGTLAQTNRVFLCNYSLLRRSLIRPCSIFKHQKQRAFALLASRSDLHAA